MREDTFGTFLPYAERALNELRKHYRSKYSKKTEDRFSIDGVAYQIGPVEVSEECGLEVEISSKIPLDRFDLDSYVERLEKELSGLVERPIKIERVRKKEKMLRGKTFKRAYFVIKTILSDENLYDNEEISRQAEMVMSGKSKINLSGYYAWPSLAGRLVLRSVKLSTKKEVENLLIALIEANKRVTKSHLEH